MASTTSNLRLTKPANGELYDIDTWNTNMQLIDNFAGTLNGRMTTSQADTIQKFVTYFQTYGIGMLNVSGAIGTTLYGKSRQALLIGYKIGNDYIIYLAIDSNGECHSGYYTTGTGTATYHDL